MSVSSKQKLNLHVLSIPILYILALLLASCFNSPKTIATTSDHWRVELWVSASCARPGETVTARATVTNVTSNVQTVDLKDLPVFDLGIGYSTPHGPVNINWSDGKPLTSELTRLELKPHESKSIEMQWKVDPAASAFGVSATLIDNPRFVDHPLSPNLLIPVSNCPGPLGP